jgi:D-alanyl-D-alanine carboxypeptidase (penicillin-binding protein 5/6)
LYNLQKTIIVTKHQLRSDQWFSLFFCLLILVLTDSLKPLSAQQSVNKLETLDLVMPSAYPVVQTDQTLSFLEQATASAYLENQNSKSTYQQTLHQLLDQITAQAYCVIDINSAAMLLEQNAYQPLYPASTVKLMTALVALDIYDLNQVLTVSNAVNADGHKIGLSWGKQILVRDLLTAILVNSGNDAAQVLANNHPKGYQGFVQAMNQKAIQLNLNQTHFSNPTGMDDYAQTTTCFDLSLLAREFLTHDFLKEQVQKQQTVITDVSGQSNYRLYNTNQFLPTYSQIQGIKTGTTPLAGEVLVTLWVEQNHPVLIIVMHSTDRYADTQAIISWLQQAVSW